MLWAFDVTCYPGLPAIPPRKNSSRAARVRSPAFLSPSPRHSSRSGSIIFTSTTRVSNNCLAQSCRQGRAESVFRCSAYKFLIPCSFVMWPFVVRIFHSWSIWLASFSLLARPLVRLSLYVCACEWLLLACLQDAAQLQTASSNGKFGCWAVLCLLFCVPSCPPRSKTVPRSFGPRDRPGFTSLFWEWAPKPPPPPYCLPLPPWVIQSAR